MNQQTAPLIRVDHLNFSLNSNAGKVDILKDISLEVGNGEQVSIVGASGSGQTSLLMLLAGLERPSGGTITLAGQNFNTLDEDGLARFRRDHMGIVFQNFHLIGSMTAIENISLPLELLGDSAHRKNHKTIEARAMDVLEKVGLGKRAQHYPSQLSGGEQQRVALARAFIGAPKLILADEPTGNLDHETGERVTKILLELCAANDTALMLVTHDPKLAEQCKRQLVMQDGHLLN
ncbi:MAG: ABC transporter ATP-binding protein [Alphaproteobacteria bacterium]